MDDTITSKIKSSSRALHPIEDVYFHQSHFKRKQAYGHPVVAVILSYNGIVLIYAIVTYNKSNLKIEIVCDIANGLPMLSYFLCNSWYTSTKVMDAFLKKASIPLVH